MALYRPRAESLTSAKERAEHARERSAAALTLAETHLRLVPLRPGDADFHVRMSALYRSCSVRQLAAARAHDATVNLLRAPASSRRL